MDEWMCSFLGRATFSAPSFPQLPVVLWVGLRPRRLFPIQFGMLISVTLVHLTFGWSMVRLCEYSF